ncbi:MAG: hypothetical protein RL226_747 [Bacteroidota bacterium]
MFAFQQVHSYEAPALLLDPTQLRQFSIRIICQVLKAKKVLIFASMKASQSSFLSTLQSSSLHALHEDDQLRLFELHQLEACAESASVFKSHEDGKKLYLVHQGLFQLMLKNGLTKELRQGAVFGEIASASSLPRLGTVFALSPDAQVISFSREDLISTGFLPPNNRPSFLQILMQNTVSYLHELLDTGIETLLMRGENEHTEFKEGALNPNILKAVAAFLNTHGGIVLLGIDDAGKAIGIPDDSLGAADKFDQDFQNLIREKMGAEALPYIHFSHHEYQGKRLYRIDCDASHQPVYLNTGKGVSGETFYIRSGATNQQLGMADAMQYISRRFPYYLK